MSNILGVLYSFVLILPTILFGADIFRLGQKMNILETRATSVALEISREGGIRPSLEAKLEEEGITIECTGECGFVSMGESLTYSLLAYYTPIIIGPEDIEIRVTRTVIVGYL